MFGGRFAGVVLEENIWGKRRRSGDWRAPKTPSALEWCELWEGCPLTSTRRSVERRDITIDMLITFMSGSKLESVNETVLELQA